MEPRLRRTLAAVLLLASPLLAQEREQAADQQVQHALSRLTFGPRPADAERVRHMGLDRWIDQQLHPERIDDREGDRVAAGFALLRLGPEELARDYPPPAVLAARMRREGDQPSRPDSVALRAAAREAQRVVGQLSAAKVARAVASERQLQEVMVDFWENHFNVFVGKGAPERWFLVAYDRDVIRPRALGNFRDLLGAVARSEAMLFYLDNWQSVADSGRATLGPAPRRPGGGNGRRRGLNENYARELLELHTLGVDGGYTQKDVIEVARAFTGWTIRRPRAGGGFAFEPRLHDAEPKTVLGQRIAPGGGQEDGERVLDIIARHPATARHIARKLAVRFVSDSPPPALVERAAATFRRTNGDIRETVRTIVTSPEFFSASAYRAKVKSPFEVVASALRAMNAEPDTTPRTAQLVARLGQPLFGHQAPDGWPETGEAWMNTGAILNRINFGLSVAGGRVPGVRAERWAPAAELRNAPRERQVDGVVAALLGGDVSPDTRRVLLSGENPLLERAARDSMPRGGRLDGLPLIVGLALGSPEFQRR